MFVAEGKRGKINCSSFLLCHLDVCNVRVCNVCVCVCVCVCVGVYRKTPIFEVLSRLPTSAKPLVGHIEVSLISGTPASIGCFQSGG